METQIMFGSFFSVSLNFGSINPRDPINRGQKSRVLYFSTKQVPLPQKDDGAVRTGPLRSHQRRHVVDGVRKAVHQTQGVFK
jgi:hypothetical protein